ncbi:MAG: hypothetical protein R3242_09960 [Akkermansiaceae bacterium]|nr:hypothetical protein [Akkermansiaceae bacterium]
MAEHFKTHRKRPSLSSNLLRILLIAGGSIAILLPAWLPNRPTVPIERGTVEMIQALLLAASAVVMFGASAHAGRYRPMARVMAVGFVAALVGEIEDFVSGILGWAFPESWLIGGLLLFAVVTALRHKSITLEFFSMLGRHAGAGLIAAALLINYVFNILIGSPAFWKAALGPAFSSDVPVICKGYLELLACYLLFIGALGLSLTMARRPDDAQ